MADKSKAEKGKAEKADAEKRVGLSALPVAAWVVMVAAALVVGVVVGHFVLGGRGGVSLDGRTTLSANELDSTIATYTFDGTVTNVTAREVLEEVQGSDAIPANDDGTYTPPAAKDVLSYVQNKLILDDAAARGITVLVSSHILSEVQQMADSVGIIHEGRLAYEDRLHKGQNLEQLFMDVCRYGRASRQREVA